MAAFADNQGESQPQRSASNSTAQTFEEDEHHKEKHLVSPTEPTSRGQISRKRPSYPPLPCTGSKAKLSSLLIAEDPAPLEAQGPWGRRRWGHIPSQPSLGPSVPEGKCAYSDNTCTGRVLPGLRAGIAFCTLTYCSGFGGGGGGRHITQSL